MMNEGATIAPKRIQRKRTKGWTMPTGAVSWAGLASGGIHILVMARSITSG